MNVQGSFSRRFLLFCCILSIFIYSKIYFTGVSKNGAVPVTSLPGRRLVSPIFEINVTASAHVRRPYASPWTTTLNFQQRKGVSIALAIGITSRKIVKNTALFNNESLVRTKFPFMSQLLPSLCKTVSPKYQYNVYLGHDNNDVFFTNAGYVQIFFAVFEKIVQQHCAGAGSGGDVKVALHLVMCNHAGKPAWAQNDAAMAAYMDNNDYIYRLNDDCTFVTPHWSETFIDGLANFKPRNVGVVAPEVGRKDIFIVDFVHKTHVDIFGFYYPRELPDWYCDDWMTHVYQPDHAKRLDKFHLKHSMSLGMRYKRVSKIGSKKPGDVQKELAKRDKAVVDRFIKHTLKHASLKKLSESLIVIPLNSSMTDLALATVIRNAQMFRLVMPQWRFQVYLSLNEATLLQHYTLNQKQNRNIKMDNYDTTIPKRSLKSTDLLSGKNESNAHMLGNTNNGPIQTESQKPNGTASTKSISNQTASISSKKSISKSEIKLTETSSKTPHFIQFNSSISSNAQHLGTNNTVNDIPSRNEEVMLNPMEYSMPLPSVDYGVDLRILNKLHDLGATVTLQLEESAKDIDSWSKEITQTGNVQNLIIWTADKVITEKDAELFTRYATEGISKHSIFIV